MIKSFFVELIYRFIWPAIANWIDRSEKKRTSDEQEANDARDRGDADDIAGRLRDRANRERDAGGGMPPANDERGTDKSG